MGFVLGPTSQALAGLAGVIQALGTGVTNSMKVLASPFGLIGNTAGALSSTLAGGEMASSLVVETQSVVPEAIQVESQIEGGQVMTRSMTKRSRRRRSRPTKTRRSRSKRSSKAKRTRKSKSRSKRM